MLLTCWRSFESVDVFVSGRSFRIYSTIHNVVLDKSSVNLNFHDINLNRFRLLNEPFPYYPMLRTRTVELPFYFVPHHPGFYGRSVVLLYLSRSSRHPMTKLVTLSLRTSVCRSRSATKRLSAETSQ